MFTFAMGFFCGLTSTVIVALLGYFLFDRAVRPPSGG
jgi:hypothetical protein